MLTRTISAARRRPSERHAASPRFIVRQKDPELLFHEPKKVERSVARNSQPPETISGTVMCYSCSLPTHHLFVKRQEIRDVKKTHLYTELIYRCQRCNTERVWGLEGVDHAA